MSSLINKSASLFICNKRWRYAYQVVNERKIDRYKYLVCLGTILMEWEIMQAILHTTCTVKLSNFYIKTLFFSTPFALTIEEKLSIKFNPYRYVSRDIHTRIREISGSLDHEFKRLVFFMNSGDCFLLWIREIAFP